MQQLVKPRNPSPAAMDAHFPTMDGQAGEAGPFQSSAWLRHWLEHRGAGLESFPIVVDGGAHRRAVWTTSNCWPACSPVAWQR